MATENQNESTVLSRTVLTENERLLERRWRIAQADPFEFDKDAEYWFPGQRTLFNILSVISLERVQEIAKCRRALFQVRLPVDFKGLPVKLPKPDNELARESIDEILVALLDRRHALCSSPDEGRVVYELTGGQAALLLRLTTVELQDLAADLYLKMEAAVNNEFFYLVADQSFTLSETSVLGTTMRKSPALAY